MRKSPETIAPTARFRFLYPALRARAGLSATLRGQPGPALRRQKTEARSRGWWFSELFSCGLLLLFAIFLVGFLRSKCVLTEA